MTQINFRLNDIVVTYAGVHKLALCPNPTSCVHAPFVEVLIVGKIISELGYCGKVSVSRSSSERELRCCLVITIFCVFHGLKPHSSITELLDLMIDELDSLREVTNSDVGLTVIVGFIY